MKASMTLPLFDDADIISIEQRMRRLFDDWVIHRAESGSRARSECALREASINVYQEMWHAFAAYCAVRSLDIGDIESDDIQTFLVIRGSGDINGRPRVSTRGDELSPRYAWRMLTLIDRITRFHARREGVAPNPAASELLQLPEYRYANASHSDPLPEYYSEAQAKRLIAYLTEFHPELSPAVGASWKQVRDRSAVALMLGAGLTPGEVRALSTGGVIIEGGRKSNLPWKLALPGNGNSPARETPVAQWAARQLAFWLSVRARQNIAGDLVFPSTLGGRAWSHTACYEACKAVLAGAGMPDDSGGVFRLRHTFALRQLSKGKSENDVARWLGLLDINSMSRYRRLLPHPVNLA
ncbi:MAG: Site-specific recombinase XerD [Herminiimonas sp.]|jgi:integrase|nr:Site-specific recombinase XerD [Herminiimonas sp.]